MSFRFRHAIVRRPAASYCQGLTTGDPGSGDIERFERQHLAYVRALRDAGLEVEVLEPIAACPDAHFVEDVAVIVPEAVVLTRPGAEPRRDETPHIEPVLQALGEVIPIDAPGTLDGGDVLVMGRQCFIGRSGRSNADGVRQLHSLLSRRGYVCTVIDVAAGLHLKSSVNAVASDTVVVTRELARHDALRAFRRVEVAPTEAYAANVLRVNDSVLIAAGYPRIGESLAALGLDARLVELDVGEARRMDGGLTCLSLRF